MLITDPEKQQKAAIEVAKKMKDLPAAARNILENEDLDTVVKFQHFSIEAMKKMSLAVACLHNKEVEFTAEGVPGAEFVIEEMKQAVSDTYSIMDAQLSFCMKLV